MKKIETFYEEERSSNAAKKNQLDLLNFWGFPTVQIEFLNIMVHIPESIKIVLIMKFLDFTDH